MEAHLPWLLDTFRPDLVLYDAGVDPHREDELGKLCLTDKGEPIIDVNLHSSTFLNFLCIPGLYRRDLYVMQTVVGKGVPVATVIGGGYSRDIDKLAIRHSIIHRAATQVKHIRTLWN